MNAKSCAAVGCDATIDAGKLCCRRHWHALPKDLRSSINDTWRRFRKLHSGAEAMAALNEYRVHRAAAMRHLGGEG